MKKYIEATLNCESLRYIFYAYFYYNGEKHAVNEEIFPISKTIDIRIATGKEHTISVRGFPDFLMPVSLDATLEKFKRGRTAIELLGTAFCKCLINNFVAKYDELDVYTPESPFFNICVDKRGSISFGNKEYLYGMHILKKLDDNKMHILEPNGHFKLTIPMDTNLFNLGDEFILADEPFPQLFQDISVDDIQLKLPF